MQAFYDNKPSKLEAVGNGSYIYRWNITEFEPDSNGQENAAGRTQWQCNEVTVWSPLSSNKITEVVITSVWANNYEQKLVNEYNAALLGVYGAPDGETAKGKIEAYTEYLNARHELKKLIDDDCAELNIR